MPPDSKRLIKGLVSAHEFPDDGTKAQQDLKGRGLVMLLHGTPGTGKFYPVVIGFGISSV